MSLDELKKLLEYNPLTGIFTWKVREVTNCKTPTWNNRNAGKEAGSISVYGYLVIVIYGKKYQAGRLAVFYMTGEWPTNEVDHRDTDQLNNKWLNLRQATPTQNQQNKRTRIDSQSGIKGVVFIPKTGKYRARIKVFKKPVHLGVFPNALDATAAYAAAAEKYFGEFARVA